MSAQKATYYRPSPVHHVYVVRIEHYWTSWDGQLDRDRFPLGPYPGPPLATYFHLVKQRQSSRLNYTTGITLYPAIDRQVVLV